MSDVDELFDDDANEQQEQQQQEQEQQQGHEDLEDDMGEEPGAAAAGGEDGEEVDVAALFGSDDDDEGGDEAGAAPAAAAGGGREEEEDQEPRGQPIEVSAPLLPRPPAERLLLLKVPNVLGVEATPFNPDTFEGGVQEVTDPETGRKRLQPNDINVIRWRLRPGEVEGQYVRESNAQYVQWSDGTESVLLGDELLTMQRKETPTVHTYLHAVRYDAIQGLAHLKHRVGLKPASIKSKLHERLKATVHKATQQSDKVQVHFSVKNPEAEKAEAEKRAEEQARLKARQDRHMARSAPREPRERRPYTTTMVDFLEADDEDEDAGGYGAAAAAGGGRDAGGSDDDGYYGRRGDDDDEAAAARLQSAKRTTPPPSGRASKQARGEAQQQRRRRQQQQEEEEDDDEDAGAAAAAQQAAAFKVRRGAILDDDDD